MKQVKYREAHKRGLRQEGFYCHRICKTYK